MTKQEDRKPHLSRGLQRKSMKATDKLSADERKRLQQLEKVIERGLDSVLEMGLALKEIREKKLYREESKTFEDFVRDRWGMAKATAYDYLAFAEVSKNVGTSRLPSVAHAHALAPFPAADQKRLAREVMALPVREMRAVVGEVREGLKNGASIADVLTARAREAVQPPTDRPLTAPERKQLVTAKLDHALGMAIKARTSLEDALDSWSEAAETFAQAELDSAFPQLIEAAVAESVRYHIDNLQTEMDDIAVLVERGQRALAAARGQGVIDVGGDEPS
jgi:hypothetical protein